MRKSLSLILSILLVLTLCLGGCNPSEPEEPSASLGESSIPEESSVPEESSQPEESSVPEESSQPEESSVPEESSLLEESSIPEESSQPEESSVPEDSSQPEESSVPEDSSQPEESSVPEDSSLPEESSIPEESSQPEESYVPEDPSRSVERPASPSAGDTEEMLAAFRDIVASLEEEHGKTTGKADGLCFVKLIDLDRDGVDELFCAWEVAQYNFYMTEIYQWIDNEAVLLHQETSFNQGTSVQPTVRFYIGDDTVYIPYGHENYYEYRALIDHKVETAFTVFYSFDSDNAHEVNGIPCTTYDEFMQALDDILGDMEALNYHFIDITYPYADEFPPVFIEVF